MDYVGAVIDEIALEGLDGNAKLLLIHFSYFVL